MQPRAWRHRKCFTSFGVNITKYAALNLSQFAEHHATRSSDFVAKDESLFDQSLLFRVRSILSQMKLNLPGRIEAKVSKFRPLVGITTSRTLLKERTFFLERLQKALG
jgi:hypothetical protein